MKAAILAVALLLVGCVDPVQQFEANMQSVEAARHSAGVNWMIDVISDPPGARIEVGNEYVGDAPCTVNVLGDSHRKAIDGEFIKAIPSQPGEYVQTKWIGGEIPSKILFVMNLGPVPPEVNVHVQNQ